MLKPIKLIGTTASDGSLTVTSTVNVLGVVKAVEWVDGDLVDGVDFTLTCVRNDGGVDLPIMAVSDANNDKVYYPRHTVHDSAGAELTFDGTRKVTDAPIVNGNLKLVIADGGNAKNGGVFVYVEC